ncbi:MAG TPA: FlgD immunoglobulin-like domain containing protein [Candidatus Krumholzibacteria bacterium]|nr:FlgD immunoglobulin-like domain containing protein [Candidatus Krumholzibacteria bacterium]
MNRGTDQTFLITPDSGYGVADVLVDQQSVGPVWEYTFPNLTGNHTIEASFVFGTGVQDSPRTLVYSLKANVPNPFNPSTTIRYALPHPSHVSLAVYDEHGSLVRTLVDAPEPAGEQATVWNGQDLEGRTVASETYLARLVTEDGVRTRKMVLAK